MSSSNSNINNSNLLVAISALGKYKKQLKDVQSGLEEEKRKREHAEQEREADRAGRIKAERELRNLIYSSQQLQLQLQLQQQQDKPSSKQHGKQEEEEEGGGTTVVDFCKVGLMLRPIGILSSCFKERNGTPRQGNLVPNGRAVLRLRPDTNPIDALDGLQEFSHVWLIFLFHENTNIASVMHNSVSAKVAPPRLNGRKVGLFSTRTPHRPNPIGLSVARIDKVEKGVLYLSGIDLIDGTPILDVKPYVPYSDSLPEGAVVVPQWIADPSHAPVTVTVGHSNSNNSNNEAKKQQQQQQQQPKIIFASEAENQLKLLAQRGSLQFYKGPTAYEDIRAALEQVLRLDIRSLHKRKTTASRAMAMVTTRSNDSSSSSSSRNQHDIVEESSSEGDGGYTIDTHRFAFDALDVVYEIKSNHVTKVVQIELLKKKKKKQQQQQQPE